jgi:hypothetical protein
MRANGFFSRFNGFLAGRLKAVETAERAFGRFFHRGKATVLIRGAKQENFECASLRLCVEMLDQNHGCQPGSTGAFSGSRRLTGRTL